MDNIKLLVCDDDNNICELLRLYLVKEGYSVVLRTRAEPRRFRSFTRSAPTWCCSTS